VNDVVGVRCLSDNASIQSTNLKHRYVWLYCSST